MKHKQHKKVSVIITALLLAFIMGASLFLALGGPEVLVHYVNRHRALGKIGDEELREAFAKMGEKNPEAEDFIEGFEGITDYDLTLDLTGEFEEGTIPYFTQWDPRWGYCRYGAGLMGWTGCGPTALSMVAMGLTGDGTLTPAYIASFAIDEGYCVPGNGTAWALFSEGAEKLGLHPKELPLWEATIRADLEAGRPVICIMGSGHFTDTGHYIVLTGCDEDGFTVLDPFRPSNCTVWPYDEIKDEIKNLWSYGVEKGC